MTNDGVIYCFGLMKLNYPHLFQYDMDETKAFENLWLIQFRDYKNNDVINALQVCIGKNRFVPTIADIKSVLFDSCREDFYSKEEMWELVLKAGSNANYHAQEEYDNLPNEIQKIVSISMLREIANSDDRSLTFIKKDFFNAYEDMKNYSNINREISSIESGRMDLECRNYLELQKEDDLIAFDDETRMDEEFN